MRHLGDYAGSTVIYGKFTTFRPSTGAAYTLGGTPALSVYKDNSTTQSTTGVTLTADFDAVTGLNHFAIDTSADGTFYSAGSNFDIVITTGTVDSVSVVGTVVASFSLAKTAALRPTTAGRTLDVSAGGEAGVDWANVGSPTTTVTLSGTTIKTATDVETDTADIQSRLPAALVGGRIDANMGAISADATAADNLEAILDGTGGVDLNIRQLISTCGDALPNIVLAGTGSADGIAFTRSGSGNPFDAEFAAQIQQEATDALNAYDPPTNAEMEARTIASASYALEATLTAMKGATFDTATDSLEAIRNRGDAAWITATGFSTHSAADVVTALGTGSSLTALASAANLATTSGEVTAIKAKTDNLAFTVAGQVDANAKSMNDATIQGNGTSGNLWRG